jgi:benzoylformate decarboxylase
MRFSFLAPGGGGAVSVGRDVVFEYLRDLGVEYLFGVPGTNEIPLIDGTAVAENDVTYVPCLHENIAVGAAMGYARLSGKPGVAELHVTPGAAHGIGNLYNAHRSHIPVVVLCAQQHNELYLQEPILSSDLVQVARQYTKWAYEVRFPEELPVALQRAFKEALTPPMRPVFLAIPWEFTMAPVPDAPRRVTRIGSRILGDRDEIARAAHALATAKSPVIVAGDGVGAAGAWEGIERLAGLVGAPVYDEPFSSYLNFPNHLPRWQGELPQTQQAQQKVFAGHDVAFLCGFNAQAHVLVFRYELGPMIPETVTQVYLHDDPWEIGKNHYGEVAILGDIATTLPSICDAVAEHPERDAEQAERRNEQLTALDEQRRGQLGAAAEVAQGDALLTGAQVAAALAKAQGSMPAPMTLVNESVSDIPSFLAYPQFDRPDAYYFAQGGSLGYSMPFSVGAKLAAGDSRTVVNTIGDGSALFYPHTWWTITRQRLPILTLVTNNRSYKTLVGGLAALDAICGWKPAGDAWYLRLDQPTVMSYVDLAGPFGVEGALVSTPAELGPALERAIATVAGGSPFVLEVLTDPSLTPPTRNDVLHATRETDDDLRYVGPA